LTATVDCAASEHFNPVPVGLLRQELPLYVSLIQEKSEHTYLWMIKDHTKSQTIHAIIIDKNVEYEGEPPSLEVKEIQYYLHFISTIPHSGQRYEHGELKDQKIRVDRDFVKLMTDAWQCVLKETKYSDESKMYLDGALFIFGSDKYCGSTVSPSTGLPAKMTELSNQLQLMVQAEQNDRNEIRNKCVELAELILYRSIPNQRVDPAR
jgi:hypothetical protein